MIISCGEGLIDFFEKDGGENFTPLIGGSLLNVAVAIQKSGTKAALMTNLSNDQFGNKLFNYLSHNAVDTSYVTRTNHLSGLMFVHYNPDKSAYYSYYGANTAEKNFDHKALKTPIQDDVNCLHFGSFSYVTGKTAESFKQLIIEQYNHKIISVDINIRSAIEPDMAIWKTQFEQQLPMTHIAKASSEDLESLYQCDKLDKDQCFAYMQKWHELGAKLCIITDAENGIYLLWQGHKLHVPALKVKIVDTVGAGDCFIANFLSALNKNNRLDVAKFDETNINQLENAAAIAVKAAAFTIQQKGAVFPSAADLAG